MAAAQTNFQDQFRGAFHREAISDQITDRILSLIREEQLRPGDKLPPERELAALMGVSRATVREALRSLAMLNVVDLRHGSGCYITSLEPKLLVENFDLVFSLTDRSFLQLIEARQVIEPGAVALAAARITPDELVRLEDVLSRSRECLAENPARFPPLDIEFHSLIASYSGNALLARIMQALSQMSIASSQRTAVVKGAISRPSVERAIRVHESILDALKLGDSELARQRMTEHLHQVEETLRGQYEGDESV
jgi:GntR family transcriptional repressor for pyruvate dehydrogenase complex